MKVDFAFFAEKVVRRERGRMDALGIFKSIRPATLPITRPPLMLYLRLAPGVRSAGEQARLPFAFFDPDRRLMFEGGIDIVIEESLTLDEETISDAINLGEITYTTRGRHILELYDGSPTPYSVSLEVRD